MWWVAHGPDITCNKSPKLESLTLIFTTLLRVYYRISNITTRGTLHHNQHSKVRWDHFTTSELIWEQTVVTLICQPPLMTIERQVAFSPLSVLPTYPWCDFSLGGYTPKLYFTQCTLLITCLIFHYGQFAYAYKLTMTSRELRILWSSSDASEIEMGLVSSFSMSQVKRTSYRNSDVHMVLMRTHCPGKS